MTTERKYRTAAGMRAALEERLNRTAGETGVDIMKLRRHVAFDRLCARLFAKETNDLIVKGGYALELRLKNARTTRDIDISFKGNPGGLWTGKETAAPEPLRDLLQASAAVDRNDFFEYVIGKAVLDLENAPCGGGYRFPVEVRMAGRIFIRFELDCAAGDVWTEPHETVQPYDWLGFAGIEAPKIPVISAEQQFAEKLHAYTLPRQTPNSRVKDLVDLLILVRTGAMDPEKVKKAAATTFNRREKQPFPPVFPGPPDNWTLPFRKLISECAITIEIGPAVSEIKKYCLGCGSIR